MAGTRIHITGASCSGVSTLGSTLASHLSIPQIDVDDFYWMPTDPPFTTKRPIEDRVRLIGERQEETEGWVLTGSCMGWGEALVSAVDLIVFVYVPIAVRLQRLDQREASRYGKRILPGGDMHEAHAAFRQWAASYEDPAAPGRNLAKHERWLREQPAPILWLDGRQTVQALAHSVRKELSCLPVVGRAGNGIRDDH